MVCRAPSTISADTRQTGVYVNQVNAIFTHT